MATPGGNLGFNPFNQTRPPSTSPITGQIDPGTSVRPPTVAPAPSSSSPPPKAINAPSKGTNNVFNGLTEALNQHQKELEKQFPGYVADEYVIEFTDSVIKDAKVTKPNLNVYKNTAGKNVNTAADKLDNNTDAVNLNSQIWEITAGTQIVQLIDQIMRSSAYITSQANGNYDKDGKWNSASSNSNGTIAWYKINISAQALKYDRVRRDFAYQIKYTISPYAINQMISPYFGSARYRGTHKVYNYWFTGLNTQIINYEQEYNQAYYTTLSGKPGALAVALPQGRDQIKNAYMATPEQRTQGQANYTNDPSDSASAFLYSVADFAEVRMKIVGDPAWMQQGEVSKGVNTKNFDYKPFNEDGGINYDSQQVVFSVSFNRPSDYDLATGIMPQPGPTQGPQETVTFIAKTCRNVFSKGEFTQDLVGSLLPLKNLPQSTANGRQPVGNTGNVAANTRITGIPSRDFDTTEVAPERDFDTTETGDDVPSRDFDTTEVAAVPSPQPANPPEPPDSTGDIDVFAGLTDSGPGETSQGPQIIAKDDA
jgi:hypothetical protein